ncbi:MAG: phosphonate C-P lyase system protein PhnH [Mesorhizobium sp.]|nr:phosphonate C-P lyase system protein PhnH [Mesorhizobium sp.]
MHATMSAIDGAFAAPVFDAQATFRAVMDAMARPGTPQALARLPRPPAPLSAVAGAIALTLCDHDTPVWLDAALSASESVREWLGFHTGAPLVRAPADAHFAFAASPAELPALEGFTQGSQDYPDRSATLVLGVASLSGGQALLLQGPGIETGASIAPHPLPRHFVEQWKQNHARFPRGVDVILAGPDAVVCLPRTVRISFAPANAASEV